MTFSDLIRLSFACVELLLHATTSFSSILELIERKLFVETSKCTLELLLEHFVILTAQLK